MDFSAEYQKDAKLYQIFSKENYGWEIMGQEYFKTFKKLAYPKSSLKLVHSKEI
jgi:glycosyltransferase involved in cell wall biosynthesis